MDISPKALYNSLRMSFLQNPTFSVERWKVEDYRDLALEELFLRLQQYDLILDTKSFLAFADEYDSPEELCDHLSADQELLDQVEPNQQQNQLQDQLYLLIFELWRRLANEKQSISIICDELDHQIFLYDQGHVTSDEALEDSLSSFHAALEENVDQGLSRDEVFEAVSEYLANDVQSFLIDYLSDLIAHQDYSYAEELLEQYYPYMPEKKWFDLIHARIIGVKDIRKGHELLAKIFHHESASPDLQFNFDVLSYLVSLPDFELFRHVAIRSLPLIQDEEEFQELLHISGDIFHSLDLHEKGDALHAVCEKRKVHALSGHFSKSDPDLIFFDKMLR